ILHSIWPELTSVNLYILHSIWPELTNLYILHSIWPELTSLYILHSIWPELTCIFHRGVNVVPFLEFIGLPEKIVGLLNHSSGGYALTAYAMYKIATPARYTVTLGGTSFSVQYLRKHGYFSTPPPVKDYLQDRMEETREKLTEKMEETKELFSEKMEETKELLSGKMEDTKERLSDMFSDKLQEAKDEVSYRKKLD
uniref:DUF1279 domain-containing protein n=1 Tax=Oncorhynchus tshawytscha TaxID=74940 RepID=A0AAZ3S688_ONCTS